MLKTKKQHHKMERNNAAIGIGISLFGLAIVGGIYLVGFLLIKSIIILVAFGIYSLVRLIRNHIAIKSARRKEHDERTIEVATGRIYVDGGLYSNFTLVAAPHLRSQKPDKIYLRVDLFEMHAIFYDPKDIRLRDQESFFQLSNAVDYGPAENAAYKYEESVQRAVFRRLPGSTKKVTITSMEKFPEWTPAIN